MTVSLLFMLIFYSITNIATLFAILSSYKDDYLEFKKLKIKDTGDIFTNIISYILCGPGFLFAKYIILIHMKILKRTKKL